MFRITPVERFVKLRRRVWNSLVKAWAYAAGFSAIAALLYAGSGGASFRRAGVSLSDVVATYVAGATLAGAAWGLLQPLAEARMGRVLVGVTAAWPVSVCLVMTAQGSPLHELSRTDWIATGVLAIAYGIGASIILRPSSGGAAT